MLGRLLDRLAEKRLVGEYSDRSARTRNSFDAGARHGDGSKDVEDFVIEHRDGDDLVRVETHRQVLLVARILREHNANDDRENRGRKLQTQQESCEQIASSEP